MVPSPVNGPRRDRVPHEAHVADVLRRQTRREVSSATETDDGLDEDTEHTVLHTTHVVGVVATHRAPRVKVPANLRTCSGS